MTIHKEGYPTLSWAVVILGLFLMAVYALEPGLLIYAIGVAVIIFLIFLQFFRNPSRPPIEKGEGIILAPADGKVVTLEEVDDPLMDGMRSMQISIFMSPINVHVNRVPIDGTLVHFSYHPGKFLPAWSPKSSTENERTELKIRTALGDVVLKQIAGAMARRIMCYKTESGASLEQGEELGFIKFGSRVDVLIPLGLDIEVRPGDRVRGNRTVLARKTPA